MTTSETYCPFKSSKSSQIPQMIILIILKKKRSNLMFHAALKPVNLTVCVC